MARHSTFCSILPEGHVVFDPVRRRYGVRMQCSCGAETWAMRVWTSFDDARGIARDMQRLMGRAMAVSRQRRAGSSPRPTARG